MVGIETYFMLKNIINTMHSLHSYYYPSYLSIEDSNIKVNNNGANTNFLSFLLDNRLIGGENPTADTEYKHITLITACNNTHATIAQLSSTKRSARIKDISIDPENEEKMSMTYLELYLLKSNQNTLQRMLNRTSII